MNLYYLGGFGVLAVVTFLVLRHLRFGYRHRRRRARSSTRSSRTTSSRRGAPYRSTYYSAPLACLLLVWAQSLAVTLPGRPDPPPARLRWHNLRAKRVAGRAGRLRVIAAPRP